MATVTERLEQVLEQEAPSWGVRPVPPERRRLSGFDLAVLWGDLSVGLLVIVTGALLVPALGFRSALLAIVIGSVIGCSLLGLAGLAGAREGVPAMVLLRPVLGIRGSYLPSVLNVAQLIGWTSFEFWAMSLVARNVGGELLGISSYGFWLVVVALVCTALALAGPVLVVRRWMKRFGAWVVVGVAAWITIRILVEANLGAIWNSTGTGGYPVGFWHGVDLVIVMPVSWLPLIADYNRFATTRAASFGGSFWGYLTGNVWLYALGVLLVLAAGAEPSPAGIAEGIAALAGGAIVLIALLVGETDEAFADIYSAAVSGQNLAPRIPQRFAIVGVAGIGAALALWLGWSAGEGVTSYEFFLFALGSFFVPLFGVFVADYFVLGRRGHGADELFQPRGRYWYLGGFNPRAIAAWLLGFLVYQWAVPTGPSWWVNAATTFFGDWLRLPVPLWGSRFGASIPSFAVAFGLYLLLALPKRERQPAAA
jgi:putative hydroxymethylpyrimidine transporter CytX